MLLMWSFFRISLVVMGGWINYTRLADFDKTGCMNVKAGMKTCRMKGRF
jgi:hypothetical protein